MNGRTEKLKKARYHNHKMTVVDVNRTAKVALFGKMTLLATQNDNRK